MIGSNQWILDLENLYLVPYVTFELPNRLFDMCYMDIKLPVWTFELPNRLFDMCYMDIHYLYMDIWTA